MANRAGKAQADFFFIASQDPTLALNRDCCNSPVTFIWTKPLQRINDLLFIWF